MQDNSYGWEDFKNWKVLKVPNRPERPQNDDAASQATEDQDEQNAHNHRQANNSLTERWLFNRPGMGKPKGQSDADQD